MMAFIGTTPEGRGFGRPVLGQQKLLYKTNLEADPGHDVIHTAERQACSTKWNILTPLIV